MFHVVWEGVFEVEVRAFFKWDSSEGVEPTLVTLLQLFGEGFVAFEGSVGHFANDSQRRGCDHREKESWYFSVEAVLETAEVGGPSGVGLSEEGDFGTDVEEGSSDNSLGSTFETLLV